MNWLNWQYVYLVLHVYLLFSVHYRLSDVATRVVIYYVVLFLSKTFADINYQIFLLIVSIRIPIYTLFIPDFIRPIYTTTHVYSSLYWPNLSLSLGTISLLSTLRYIKAYYCSKLLYVITFDPFFILPYSLM